MIEIPAETISILEQIYVVSNTPGYLYKHFRREAGVERLAHTYSAEQLVEHIVEVESKEGRTLADVASAYAACVALTFHDLRLVLELMNRVELQKLEWVEAIVNIWDKSYIPMQVVYPCYTHKPDIRLEGKRESDVGTERIDIAYEHKPKIGDRDLFRSGSSKTDLVYDGERDG